MEQVVFNWKSVYRKIAVCLISIMLLILLITIKHHAVSFLNKNIIYLYISVSLILISTIPVLSFNKDYVLYYQKIDLIMILFIFILVIQSIFSFAFFKASIDGRSMYPTLKNDETVIVKVTKNVERGDVVVLYVDKNVNTLAHGLRNNDLLVKRVIGVSGDNVYAIDGIIYINGNPIDDYTTAYTNDFDLKSIIDCTKGIDDVTTIPEGYVLVLGDNRSVSNDSRYIGLISTSQLLGKAIYKMNDNILKWSKIE